MFKVAAFRAVTLLGIVFFAGSGCKKKEASVASPESAPEQAATAPATAPTATPAAPRNPGHLPGAADVRAALARKEYSTAIESYLALKDIAYTESQWIDEYRRLNDDLMTKLNQAAPTDPKAAQALAVMRAAILGR
jgi:hypothetical protein